MPANPPHPRADATAAGVAGTGLGQGACSQAEENLLAFLLIHTWTLTTGRILRSDVPPAQLSEDELIAFWADDHISHAAREPLLWPAAGMSGQ